METPPKRLGPIRRQSGAAKRSSDTLCDTPFVNLQTVHGRLRTIHCCARRPGRLWCRCAGMGAPAHEPVRQAQVKLHSHVWRRRLARALTTHTLDFAALKIIACSGDVLLVRRKKVASGLRLGFARWKGDLSDQVFHNGPKCLECQRQLLRSDASGVPPRTRTCIRGSLHARWFKYSSRIYQSESYFKVQFDLLLSSRP